MIVKINNILQFIYSFIPQEVFIIIISGVLYLIYEFFRGKREKWTKEKLKRN